MALTAWKPVGSKPFISNGYIQSTASNVARKITVQNFNSYICSVSSDIITVNRGGVIRVLISGSKVSGVDTPYPTIKLFKNGVEVLTASSGASAGDNACALINSNAISVVSGDTLYATIIHSATYARYFTATFSIHFE